MAEPSTYSPLRQKHEPTLSLDKRLKDRQCTLLEVPAHFESKLGMSQAHDNATAPTQRTQISEMAVPRGQHSDLQPAGRETIASKGAGSQTHKHKQNIDYVLRSGLAGGLAGCAAKTAVGPLDRVKILFQASSPQFAKYTGSWFGVVTAMKDINRQDGMRGLFRGHSATLLRIFPYAAIKFIAYEQVRAVLISSPAQETTVRRLLSGSIAGVTSVFFTYPLEVIRVRLAFETRKDFRSSLSSICRQIYHEKPHDPSAFPTQSTNLPNAVVSAPKSGIINFYRGFSPTLVGMVPYAGVSFLTHDTAKDWLRDPLLAPYTVRDFSNRDSNTPMILKAWAQLLAGGLAGLVSQTASYPLEVIRRRMQVGGAVGDGHRLGIAETASRIYKETGFRGFWVGLTIGYVKVVPMVAVSFFTYERMKWVLGV